MSLRSDMSACRRGEPVIMHSCASLLENITSLGNCNSSARVMRGVNTNTVSAHVSYLGFQDITLSKHLVYTFTS